MDDRDLSAGIWLVWLLASDAAHHTAASTIQPAHLLIGLCKLCGWDEIDPTDLDPEFADELTHEAAELRARFDRAGLDPVVWRRRIRTRLGGVTTAGSPPERVLHRSPATRAMFVRATALADLATVHRVNTVHLLRAVLESPEPEWVQPASELGVADPLAACFPPMGLADETVVAPQVRFEVCDGELTNRRFVFTERARWIIGRSDDCHLKIPDDTLVSRHHCLIDVNPPAARLRDLGSRNGTFVNGNRLGAPPADHDNDASQAGNPEHDLADGDLITVGATVLRVRIVVSPKPMGISTSLLIPAAGLPHCRVCDEEIECTGKIWGYDPELCLPCRHDPDRVVRILAEHVGSGTEKGGVFGGYTIIRRIGIGGMGAVYLARDEQTGEPAALKIMLPKVATTDQSEREFLREAANAKLLRHQYIVRQREYGQWHGIFFIVMDYCEGGNLYQLMDRSNGRLPVGRAVGIAVQALEALSYAHDVEVPVRLLGDRIMVSRGLAHRDIGPGNLLFSEGMVKLADFGLSKAFDSVGLSGITQTGTLAGKPQFVPRQQVVEYRRPTPAVDVWSVAACLYFMLTGLPPRDFDPHTAVWSVVLETSAVPIRERDRAIPPTLAAVIDQALVDDPDIGFQTAQAFRDALLAARP